MCLDYSSLLFPQNEFQDVSSRFHHHPKNLPPQKQEEYVPLIFCDHKCEPYLDR